MINIIINILFCLKEFCLGMMHMFIVIIILAFGLSVVASIFYGLIKLLSVGVNYVT